MFTTDDKVMFLTKKINILASDFDQDFHSLVGEGVSEEIAGMMIKETVVAEIDKLVTMFERINPGIAIYNVERVADENGESVVNLDWEENETTI